MLRGKNYENMVKNVKTVCKMVSNLFPHIGKKRPQYSRHNFDKFRPLFRHHRAHTKWTDNCHLHDCTNHATLVYDIFPQELCNIEEVYMIIKNKQLLQTYSAKNTMLFYLCVEPKHITYLYRTVGFIATTVWMFNDN